MAAMADLRNEAIQEYGGVYGAASWECVDVMPFPCICRECSQNSLAFLYAHCYATICSLGDPP